MIRLNNISKKYSNVNVLNGVNLEINDGDVYGLVGENGAGKTTLLNIVAGITESTEGKIYIDSKLVTSTAFENFPISYLPDLPNFFDCLTGREYLDFLSSAKKCEIDNNIDLLISQMNLDLNKKIKHLSRGNRQKLGIISAVMCKPKILLLDEPTSALDPIGRKDTMDLIKKLKQLGITIIFSTHILSDLETVCDRIGFLHKGIIAKEINLKTQKRNDFCYEINVATTDTRIIKDYFAIEAKQWDVIIEDNIVTITPTDSSEALASNNILEKLSSAPFDIIKIERRGTYNLEQVMEEVLKS